MKGFVLQATSWILAFAVAMLTCILSMPVTPRGVQCPTAAIQKIQVVSYEHLPCGCIVKKVTERAPHEGEAGFKQCRCAERKAADKQEQSASAESKPILTMACGPIVKICFTGSCLMRLWVCTAYATSTRTAPTFSPATPPPQLA